MCPACIESAAVMVAGAASTGGVLAVCVARFRLFFKVSRLWERRKRAINPGRNQMKNKRAFE
jgi:hypothetical protein